MWGERSSERGHVAHAAPYSIADRYDDNVANGDVWRHRWV
jgi:hypothetical protein